MLNKGEDRIKSCPAPTRKEAKDAIPSQNICRQNGGKDFQEGRRWPPADPSANVSPEGCFSDACIWGGSDFRYSPMSFGYRECGWGQSRKAGILDSGGLKRWKFPKFMDCPLFWSRK